MPTCHDERSMQDTKLSGGRAATVALRRGQLVQGRGRAQVNYFAKEEEAAAYRRAAAERDDA